jgi:hypothetical protein
MRKAEIAMAEKKQASAAEDETPVKDDIRGAEINAGIRAESQKALQALTALETQLQAQLLALKGLKASEAVSGARSTLALVDDVLARGKKALETTIKQLPPSGEDT